LKCLNKHQLCLHPAPHFPTSPCLSHLTAAPHPPRDVGILETNILFLDPRHQPRTEFEFLPSLPLARFKKVRPSADTIRFISKMMVGEGEERGAGAKAGAPEWTVIEVGSEGSEGDSDQSCESARWPLTQRTQHSQASQPSQQSQSQQQLTQPSQPTILTQSHAEVVEVVADTEDEEDDDEMPRPVQVDSDADDEEQEQDNGEDARSLGKTGRSDMSCESADNWLCQPCSAAAPQPATIDSHSCVPQPPAPNPQPPPPPPAPQMLWLARSLPHTHHPCCSSPAHLAQSVLQALTAPQKCKVCNSSTNSTHTHLLRAGLDLRPQPRGTHGQGRHQTRPPPCRWWGGLMGPPVLSKPCQQTGECDKMAASGRTSFFNFQQPPKS
jgi:hypothetical protein